MHITLESDYATRIAYCLAKAPGRMDAKSISEETGVTLRFSLKILRKLVASGIVKSCKAVSYTHLDVYKRQVLQSKMGMTIASLLATK